MLFRLLRIILMLFVASIASLITLWLLDPPFKYVLFIYEVGLITSLFVFFEYRARLVKIRISFGAISKKNWKWVNSSKLLDFLIVGGSLFLLFSEIVSVKGNMGMIVTTLGITAFGSGYSVLNILGITKYFSRLELLSLSFLASLLVSGLLFFMGVFASLPKDYFLPLVFLSLGILSAIKNRIYPNPTSHLKSLSQSRDLVPLFMAVIFYLILFAFLLPNLASSIYTDSSDLYRMSVALPRAPSLYYAMSYVLFSLFQSSFIFVSSADMIPSQVALGFLPLMLIPSFYIAVKKYLEKVDIRLSSLSTLFWCIFASGLLGWVYFLQLRIGPTSSSTLGQLTTTAYYTYYSTMYGIVGYTFVGFTVAFIALLTAIFLIKCNDIPKLKFYFLFSCLIIIMFLSHVTEAVVFTLFLVIWGFGSSKESSIRINDALIASLIAFLSVIAFYGVASQVFYVFWNFQIDIALVAPTLLLAIAIIFRRANGWRITSVLGNTVQELKNWKFKAVLVFLFIYILSSLTCLFSIGTFNVGQLAGIWNVPWFVYPLVLGLNGLLAVVASIFISRNEQIFKSYRFFIIFLLYALILGRTISFVNLTFFSTGYWESRFTYYMAISVAAMAPIPLLKFVSFVKNRYRKSTYRILLTVSIIGIMVAAGISTTFLNVEYWSIRFAQNQPSALEMNAIDEYRAILATDPYACSGTITALSQEMTILSAPSDIIPPENRLVLGSANTPELALQVLGSPLWADSHYYLYMNKRDFLEINNNAWNTRFLASHLIPMLPKVFENSEVTIYNVSRLAPPLPMSNQILVLPFNENESMDENQLFSYDLLSNGLYNYTTAFDTDSKIFYANTLLLSSDLKEESTQEHNVAEFNQFVSSGGSLIVLNTNGIGVFGKMFFNASNDTLEASYITGELGNLTLPQGVVVPTLEQVNQTEEILSNYASSNGTSPYMTKMNIGKGRLIYVNVEPLIRYLDQTNSLKSEIYQISGNLLKGAKLQPYDFQHLTLSSGYAQGVHINSKVKIDTTAILFSTQITQDAYRIQEIEVTNDFGNSIFQNVTSIQIGNFSQAEIQLPDAILTDGSGFYTQLSLNETSKLNFAPTAHLKITSDNEEFEVANVSTILMTAYSPISIWVRTPSITAENVTFKEVSGLLGTSSGDLIIGGGVTFSVATNDDYLSLNDFQNIGVVISSSQNYYNEWQSLPLAITISCVLVFPLTIVLLPVWLFRRKHKRIRFQFKRQKAV